MRRHDQVKTCRRQCNSKTAELLSEDWIYLSHSHLALGVDCVIEWVVRSVGRLHAAFLPRLNVLQQPDTIRYERNLL